MQLSKTLNAWGTPEFDTIFKSEIEQLDARQLPLQQALTTASYALNSKPNVMIIGISEDPDSIYVKTGIFYSGIIAGCSCADDPTPVDATNEYCTLQFDIDKATAETSVTLLME